MFFAEERNTKILGSFLRKAEAAHITDEARKSRLALSIEIISFIHRSPEKWDKRCSFNIKHIGEQYIGYIQDFDPKNLQGIDSIYTISYRFLCEFDFLVGAGKELSFDLNSIKYKIQHDTDTSGDHVLEQIIYASYVMPANIAKEFINDANIGVFRDFEQKKEEAENLKEQWDKEIEDKKIEASNLKDKLDEYRTGFNFVGLEQGFSKLGTQKTSEARVLFWSLLSIGIITLIPLIIEIKTAIEGLYKGEILSTDHLMVLLPLLSIEVILIYFFRVILTNYKSVKAQKMQIELRQTLCQFIQSYAEYSSKIKEKDAAALEKFENLIFSGILSDPGKLPSTFDGLDQIGDLIQKLKN